MLKMAGVQTRPVMRIAIGAIVMALGFIRDSTAPLVIGGVLVVWGFVAVLGLAVGAGGEGGSR
jgi:hypothetical protein